MIAPRILVSIFTRKFPIAVGSGCRCSLVMLDRIAPRLMITGSCTQIVDADAIVSRPEMGLWNVALQQFAFLLAFETRALGADATTRAVMPSASSNNDDQKILCCFSDIYTLPAQMLRDPEATPQLEMPLRASNCPCVCKAFRAAETNPLLQTQQLQIFLLVFLMSCLNVIRRQFTTVDSVAPGFHLCLVERLERLPYALDVAGHQQITDGNWSAGGMYFHAYSISRRYQGLCLAHFRPA